jgi:hypothetical protein
MNLSVTSHQINESNSTKAIDHGVYEKKMVIWFLFAYIFDRPFWETSIVFKKKFAFVKKSFK